MARKPKHRGADAQDVVQLPLDFDDLIRSAKVYSRDEVAADATAGDPGAYSPTEQTAAYMHRAVQFEAAWETTIQRARESLLVVCYS